MCIYDTPPPLFFFFCRCKNPSSASHLSLAYPLRFLLFLSFSLKLWYALVSSKRTVLLNQLRVDLKLFGFEEGDRYILRLLTFEDSTIGFFFLSYLADEWFCFRVWIFHYNLPFLIYWLNHEHCSYQFLLMLNSPFCNIKYFFSFFLFSFYRI